MSERITRRALISKIAGVGGMGAALLVQQALGMSMAVSPHRRLPAVSPSLGRGIRVIVLGAGIAGLVAAYELSRGGFDVLVLEAQSRFGGRVLTLRGGDRLLQTDGEQDCGFDPGLYMNAGAARIPTQHRGILHYCNRMNVPLETAINYNPLASIRHTATSGEPRVIGDMHREIRRSLAELLTKALAGDRLDESVSTEDLERLVGFLRAFGGLSQQDVARVHKSGAETTTGVNFRVSTLLDVQLWHWLALEERAPLMGTLLQPVGGMDQLIRALAQEVGTRLRLGCAAREIREKAAAVAVVYEDLSAGIFHEVRADYCVCTMPPPLVARLKSNLPEPLVTQFADAAYEPATKIAWQSPRFWEQDQSVYGGVAFSGDLAATVWYPSEGLNTQDGVLVGAYTTGFASESVASRSYSQQYEISRRAVEHLHPARSGLLKVPIAVSWSRARWVPGAWPRGPMSLEQQGHRLLFAGDAMSSLPGWQEGAVTSASSAVETIFSRTIQH